MTEEEIAALVASKERLEEELTATRKESATRRVALREFEGVDPDEFSSMKKELAEIKTKTAEASGKEEDIIKAIKEQKDAEIAELSSKLSKIQGDFKAEVIDKKLVSEAAKLNAVNPEQISLLLRNNIRLSEKGDIEILGGDGSVKYDADGKNISVESYVENFMKENLHFARGVESGSGSTGGEAKPKETVEVDEGERLRKAIEKWG